MPLPEPGSGRAVTFVDNEGRHIAALVHDAALSHQPELLEVVCAAANVAIERERLQAELGARVVELRASRERIVSAGDAERRRLERNLHDGAQQRLVAIALQLRLLQGRIHDDPSAEQLVTTASDELALSMAELRELARGLHPAVLEHGLATALEGLAARSTVYTTVSYEPPGRLPEAVELAAYFVASEALANVGKYAQATTVTMRVWRAGRLASIEVADDGIGGARRRRPARACAASPTASRRSTASLRVVSPPGRRHDRHRGAAVRVVIAEDSLLVRAGIVALLRGAGIDVVAEATCAEELLRAVDEHRPDVAIVDIRMPPDFSDEGVVAAHALRARHPAIGIVILSSHVDLGTATRVLAERPESARLPAQGPRRRRRRVRRRRCGASPRAAPPSTPRSCRGCWRATRDDGPLQALTPRELEVLQLVAEGRSNKGIGDRLAVSERAVQKHVTAIFGKFGLAGRRGRQPPHPRGPGVPEALAARGAGSGTPGTPGGSLSAREA